MSGPSRGTFFAQAEMSRAPAVTSISEIVDLNRGEKISEIDPFTELRYEQFVSHLPPEAPGHNGCRLQHGPGAGL